LSLIEVSISVVVHFTTFCFDLPLIEDHALKLIGPHVLSFLDHHVGRDPPFLSRGHSQRSRAFGLGLAEFANGISAIEPAKLEDYCKKNILNLNFL
jgi:hypothetical protein